MFTNNNGLWTQQQRVVLLMVTAYDDIASNGFQSGDAFILKRGGSTWTEQPTLYMAPEVNGIPGPGQDKQRFGNFSTITKLGSQTIFVIGSQTYSNPNAAQVGADYTATLN